MRNISSCVLVLIGGPFAGLSYVTALLFYFYRDNGSENHDFTQLEEELLPGVWLANHTPGGEGGTHKNINGLLRRFHGQIPNCRETVSQEILS